MHVQYERISCDILCSYVVHLCAIAIWRLLCDAALALCNDRGFEYLQDTASATDGTLVFTVVSFNFMQDTRLKSVLGIKGTVAHNFCRNLWISLEITMLFSFKEIHRFRLKIYTWDGI